MSVNKNIIASTLLRLNLYRNKPGLIFAIRNLVSDIRSKPQSIRVMRFAIGVTLAVAISSAIAWPLAFLLPILTSVFLAKPMPMLGLKAGLVIMVFTVSAFFIGLVFTLFLLPYPLAYIPMLALVLFNLYYMLNRGGPFLFVLLSLLAILILPMLGINSGGLAKGVAFGFVISGCVMVPIIWFAYLIMPDQNDTPPLPKKPGLQKSFSLPAAQAALKSTVVVLPMAILFITFNLSSLIVVLVFTATFTLAPDISKGKGAGINSLKSTLIGGAYAFIFYHLLVAVPEFYFFITLMFLTTLYFAGKIFSDNPSSQYYASAFSTLFILVNSSLGEGADFTSAFIMRFTFILLATIYVVFSLMVFESFWPQKQNNG